MSSPTFSLAWSLPLWSVSSTKNCFEPSSCSSSLVSNFPGVNTASKQQRAHLMMFRSWYPASNAPGRRATSILYAKSKKEVFHDSDDEDIFVDSDDESDLHDNNRVEDNRKAARSQPSSIPDKLVISGKQSASSQPKRNSRIAVSDSSDKASRVPAERRSNSAKVGRTSDARSASMPAKSSNATSPFLSRFGRRPSQKIKMNESSEKTKKTVTSLGKYMTLCNVASYETCEILVKHGFVTLNGEQIKDPVRMVRLERDTVCVHGKAIKLLIDDELGNIEKSSKGSQEDDDENVLPGRVRDFKGGRMEELKTKSGSNYNWKVDGGFYSGKRGTRGV